MSQANAWVPLFPIKTVLFPGGILPLKVFETRYVDMLRECMRQSAPFGVVLTNAGTPEPERIGCLAYISHSDMPTLDLMILRTRGGERFRTLETRVLPDQRLEARIEMIEADGEIPISDMHVHCAKTLKLVLDDIDAKGQAQHGDAFDSPFARPLQLENAAWVANRWCEILPIPLKARQKLLELDNAQSRLAIVYQYLQQHKII
jgi:Lon protease-like protein